MEIDNSTQGNQTTINNDNNNNTTTEIEEWETVLTFDVLVNIFFYLDSKKELNLCASVCKKWRKVANNPIFLWEVIRQLHTEYLIKY